MTAVCALIAASGTAHADLVNRWSFNNPAGNAAAGTSITADVGTALATVVGNGATFTGTSLVLPGTTTGNQSPGTIAGYVDLPNGLISSKTNLSVEIWATPVSIKNWQRLFNFGRMNSGFGSGLTSSSRGTGAATGEILPTATAAPNNAASYDDLAFAVHRGTADNTQRVLAENDGTPVNVDSGATLALGTRYHFLLTFADGVGTYGSAGGRITWFLNGTQISTLDVNFHLSNLSDVNNWLGRSMYTADSNANIAYDEVRLYNHVLSAAEISANIAEGPDPEPVAPPTPDHLWTFTTQAQLEATAGTTFTDSIGGEVATLKGNGGSLTGGAVVLPGTTTGNQPAATISAYLDLPNGIASETANVSFEAWASPLSSKNWQRLFDFGRCATSHGGGATGEILDTNSAPGGYAAYDNLSLTFNNADNINSQQLEGQYDGNAAQYSFSTATTVVGTQYHYVLVVEDTETGCTARWYRNGVLQNTANYAFHMNDMEDVNNWIGRSMYGGDSNSHLSLNEFRIYRRVITAAEIQASYAAGPDPTVGPAEPPVAAPIPSRRWNFNTAAGSAPTGTQFLDSATGEIATVRGNGATTNGTELVLPSTATTGNQTAANISAYLDLPNGIVSSRPSLTFEAWITPLSSKNWQRIFDFGNTSITSGTGAAEGEIIDGATAPGAFVANDNLFLSLNNGGTLGSHRLEAKLNGAATVTSNTDLSSATSVGTQYHFVMTVKDGGGSYGTTGCLVKWYRNGSLVGSVDLPYRLPDLQDVNNWIGRSMWAADTNGNFEIDELRLYDRAISISEVNSSYTAGASATFAPPIVVNDSATVYPGQKVLVDVLANDSGNPVSSSLAIASPPSVGTATVVNGKILYTHVGSSTTPVTFTYQVGNVSGTTSTATVTVTLSNSLRVTNPELAMPTAPPATAFQTVDALPGVTFDEPICIASIPGDSTRLFVGERLAKIQLVPDVTATSPTKTLFLDLQGVVAGRSPTETIENWDLGENGLLGFAFHPNYASNGYFYVAYTVRINGGSYYQRVSRFKVSTGDPTVADPASELILIQQLDEVFNHNGGDLHFGPDGYLYYAAGDEANPYDYKLNSQKINKDFFAGIFRIDVDKKPGNLEPNAHASIPTDNGIARFSVPVDNPFVHASLNGPWDGTYSGVTITPLSGVRTEFWATGLRHIWRMSFDELTGDLWAGDVGQDTYEEVNLIQKGGNYGWVYREGAHDTNFTNPAPPTKPAGFTSIDPVYEYVHASISGGDAQFKGNSVCGGYVYRGSRFPALYGCYIFCDSVSGHIWSRNPTTGTVTRITGVPGVYGALSSMGVDPSNKDLLFADYLNGKILRLATGTTDTTFPATLSATGLFADLTDLSPSPGLLPYEPNLTFWSDFAVKRRWFSIPQANDTMTWMLDENWTYPSGMVWVKHFDLEMTRGVAATKRRIETRVVVKTDGGSYGVSYRWNDAQTEATLVPDEGAEFNLDIVENGTPRTQRWQIPSRSSCLTCHTPQAGHALSFNTRQLNRTHTINGVTGNQLTVLRNAGYLANDPGSPNILPRHVRPDETDYSLEARVRSYLAVNCAYCHQEGGTVAGANWDGSAHLTLAETGLIDGEAENNGGNSLNKYIVRGDATHSIVLNRMAVTNGFTRMPPLGSSELDQTNIDLVQEWITQSLPERQTYDEWRLAEFGSSSSSEGTASSDPDGDGQTNEQEFIANTDPRNPASFLTSTLSVDGTTITLTFNVPEGRSAWIETSSDLNAWTLWDIPGNNGLPLASGPVSFSGPASGAKQFFRLRLQGN
jgi:uncharacterized repeat protein (TIGR03806 family)